MKPAPSPAPRIQTKPVCPGPLMPHDHMACLTWGQPPFVPDAPPPAPPCAECERLAEAWAKADTARAKADAAWAKADVAWEDHRRTHQEVA